MLRQYKEVLTSGWSRVEQCSANDGHVHIIMVSVCINHVSTNFNVNKMFNVNVMNDQLSLQLPIIVLPRIY